MGKVWRELSGTMENRFKFGRHRLFSYDNHVALEQRNGAPLMEVAPNFYKVGGKTFYFGTAIPTTGTYNTGDVLWNSLPANDILCWYCYSGGTPGLWRPLRAVQEQCLDLYVEQDGDVVYRFCNYIPPADDDFYLENDGFLENDGYLQDDYYFENDGNVENDGATAEGIGNLGAVDNEGFLENGQEGL